jgi:hypothetical protein
MPSASSARPTRSVYLAAAAISVLVAACSADSSQESDAVSDAAAEAGDVEADVAADGSSSDVDDDAVTDVASDSASDSAADATGDVSTDSSDDSADSDTAVADVAQDADDTADTPVDTANDSDVADIGGDVAIDAADDTIADVSTDPGADTDQGTPGVIGLSLVLDSSGGFAGTGNRDIAIEASEMTVTSLDGTCTASLTVRQRTSLFNAAAEVSWTSLPDDFLPPDNPSCCCDQFVYNLNISWLVLVGSGGSAVVDWCDQSVADGLLRPAFASFIAELNAVADAVEAACS